jgi:hypothetical protein
LSGEPLNLREVEVTDVQNLPLPLGFTLLLPARPGARARAAAVSRADRYAARAVQSPRLRRTRAK